MLGTEWIYYSDDSIIQSCLLELENYSAWMSDYWASYYRKVKIGNSSGVHDFMQEGNELEKFHLVPILHLWALNLLYVLSMV